MATVWQDMMVLGAPLTEKILRAVLVYMFLIVGLRLAGKRELAQLNPFDLVVLLTLSNTVQNAIIGNDNSVIGGLIGATTLLAVNYLVVRFLYSHEKLERAVEGAPEKLIDHGEIQHHLLKKEFINLEELEAACRRQGIESLKEIEEAILESGGTISFLRKEPTPEIVRYHQLVERLDKLSADIRDIRTAIAPPPR